MTTPARLPNGAPAALRGFVACTVDRVELDLAEMGWIPKPPGMDRLPEPGVSVDDGWTPSTAIIKVGWGFVSIELPTSIVDGRLHIDTSHLLLEGIGDEIDKWVGAFNRTLHDNDKQLDTFEVDGDRVTMTKRAVVATAPDAAPTVAPVATAVPGTPTPDDPTPRKSPPGGCLTWAVAGITAIAVAVGLYVVTNGGGDEQAVTSGSEAAAATTPSSSTTSTTSTTSSTVVELGQVPPPPSDAALAACGDFPSATPGGPDRYPGFDDPTCAPVDGAYLPTNCDEGLLHCSLGQAPGILVPGTPGIDHSRRVIDPDTGQESASTADHLVWGRIFTGDEPIIRLRAECGGSGLTGQAPMNNGSVTNVEQSLQSYGSCRMTALEAAAERYIQQNDVDLFDPAAVSHAAAAIRDGSFNVDASEPAPIPPAVDRYAVADDRWAVRNDWADSVNTINNTLGNTAVAPGCMWFFEPQNVDLVVQVLDRCQQRSHFWVFAAGLTDVEYTLEVHDTLLGTTSTFTNPSGVVGAPVADSAPFVTSRPLFDNTIFPCGYGHVAYTACAADRPPVDAGAFVTVSGVFLDPVPIEGNGSERSHTVDFSSTSGPEYSIEQEPDGWTVTSSSGATRARALFRHDSITLVVPQDELPEGPLASSWSTTVDGQTVSQPVVPVVGLITTPQVTAAVGDAAAADSPPVSESPAPESVVATESLAEFYAQLSVSVAAGDAGFSLDRLHPTVLEAYPTECPAALASFADPELVIDFVSDNGPEPWMWELPDGRSFDIVDAVSVTIRVDGRGQTGAESNAHVAIVDGTYRWFTFCTTP